MERTSLVMQIFSNMRHDILAPFKSTQVVRIAQIAQKGTTSAPTRFPAELTT